MTGPAARAWSVTLSFAPPGPLHATLILAPDRDSAVALAVMALMSATPTDADLHAVIASEVPADTLRRMLRAVEGRMLDGVGGELLRLVPEMEHLLPVGSLRRVAGDDRLTGLMNAAISCHHGHPLESCPKCIAEQTHHRSPDPSDAA